MTRYVKNVGGVEINMTAQEITERQDEEAVWAIKQVEINKDATRVKKLGNVWPDAFALLDDVLARGIEAVKADRDAIKALNPKGKK
jgi:hypothetical protein